MTRPDAVDYSFGRPTSPQALRAQGINLVMRYLSPPPNGKNLSRTEAQGLLSAGLGILLGWETTANRALSSRPAGLWDGKDAADLAESLGAPHGLTIYYAVDFDTNPSQYPTIAEYFRGVGTDKRYRVGIYGEADVIEAMHKLGVVTSEWQTYAWSRGRLSPEADFYQYLNGQTVAGVTVDFDRIIHPEALGAWWPGGLIPLGGGTPITGGFLMALDDAHQQTMFYEINNQITPAVAATRAMVLALYNAHPDTPQLSGDDMVQQLTTIIQGMVASLPADTAAATIAAIKAAL